MTIHPVGKGSRSVEFDYFEEYSGYLKGERFQVEIALLHEFVPG